MNRLNVNSAIVVKNRTYKVADLVENFICFTGLQASEILLSLDFRIPKKIRMNALKKVLNEPVQELRKSRLTIADEKKYRLSWFLTYSEFQLENLLASFKDDHLNYEYLKELWLMVLSYMIDVKFSEDNLLVLIKEAEKIKELKITNNILRYNLSLSKVFVDEKGEIDGLTPDTFRPVLFKSATIQEIRDLAKKYELSVPQRLKKDEFLDQILNKLKTTNRFSEKIEAELSKMTITQLQRFSTNNKLKLSIDLNKESIIEFILSESIQTSSLYIKPSSNAIYEIELEDIKGIDEEDIYEFETSGLFKEETYQEIKSEPLYQKIETTTQNKTFIDDTYKEQINIKEETSYIPQSEELQTDQTFFKEQPISPIQDIKPQEEKNFETERKELVALRNLLIAVEMRVNALYGVLENTSNVRLDNIERLRNEVFDIERFVNDYKNSFNEIDEKLKLSFDNDLISSKNDIRDFIMLIERKKDTSKSLLNQIEQKLKEEEILKKANENIEREKEKERFKDEYKKRYNSLLNQIYNIEPRFETLRTNVELLNFNSIEEIDYDKYTEYKLQRNDLEREYSNLLLLNEELSLKYRDVSDNELLIISNQATLKLDIIKNKLQDIKECLLQIENKKETIELKRKYEEKKRLEELEKENAKLRQEEERRLQLEEERKLQEEKEIEQRLLQQQEQRRKYEEEQRLLQQQEQEGPVEINTDKDAFNFSVDFEKYNTSVDVTDYSQKQRANESQIDASMEEFKSQEIKQVKEAPKQTYNNYIGPASVISPIVTNKGELEVASEKDLILDDMPNFLDKYDSKKNKPKKNKRKEGQLSTGGKLLVFLTILLSVAFIVGFIVIITVIKK